MLTKKADFAFTDIHPVNTSDINTQGVLMRTASANRIIIEPGSEKSKVIEAEIKKHPNSLFFRAKSIEANKPNTNGIINGRRIDTIFQRPFLGVFGSISPIHVRIIRSAFIILLHSMVSW